MPISGVVKNSIDKFKTSKLKHVNLRYTHSACNVSLLQSAGLRSYGTEWAVHSIIFLSNSSTAIRDGVRTQGNPAGASVFGKLTFRATCSSLANVFPVVVASIGLVLRVGNAEELPRGRVEPFETMCYSGMFVLARPASQKPNGFISLVNIVTTTELIKFMMFIFM